jgi:hypothetical protein
MKLMTIGDFHGYPDWFARIEKFIFAEPQEVDVLAVTGNLCNMLTRRDDAGRDTLSIRSWLERICARIPVHYAPSGYDPDSILQWDIDNLFGPGDHIHDGWRIHVMSMRRPGDEIRSSNLPTIIVSDIGPTLSRSAMALDGSDLGRCDVYDAVQAAGDCRLIIHGGCLDPVARMDWTGPGSALAVNTGLPYLEHGKDPAFALIDCDSRVVNLFDGERMHSKSFVREF